MQIKIWKLIPPTFPAHQIPWKSLYLSLKTTRFIPCTLFVLITALWVWYIQELLIWLSCSRWGIETSHQSPKVTWNHSNQHSWVHLVSPLLLCSSQVDHPSTTAFLREASLPPQNAGLSDTHQLACFFTLVQANFPNILLKKLKTSKLKIVIHSAAYLDSNNVLPYQPGFYFIS